MTPVKYQNTVVQQFVPLPKQELFMYDVLKNPGIKFTWYCGGFGSGKSYIGSQTAIRLALAAPGGRGLISRATLVDLKATTMKTFFEVCDPRLIRSWNKTENLLTFYNGHEIYFWGLDDIEKLKSLELGWFWMDEVDEVQQIAFEVAQGRLRHKAQPRRVGFITSNSEGKNWTYQKFVKGEGVRSKEDLAKYAVIKAPSNENTYLPDDYLEVLNSYTGDLYARYVNASFDVFEGQIFKEFVRAIHVIKPFSIPREWIRVRGIDHGERNPTAVLWAAISPDFDVYVYREYYDSGHFVAHHAKEIAEMCPSETIAYSVIDPSTKSTRGGSGKKVDKEWVEEMRKYETDFRLKFGVNSVNAGIAKMHRYLYVDPDRVHPVTGAHGAPRLFVFDTCTVTADQLESYKWSSVSNTDENDPQEKPRKREDHTTDALRYIIMSRPGEESGTVHQKAKRGTSLLAIKPGKRDQILPITDNQILENLKRKHPEDFLI